MKRLLIVGAGGHGKVVADAAQAAGWGEILFIDGRYPSLSKAGAWRVICNDRELLAHPPHCDGVIVAIGNNRTRVELQRRYAEAGLPIATIVHPQAVVSPYTSIGAGTVVFARAVINIDAMIGEAVIINTGAVVEHDCRLGAGVHVSPLAALAGGVTIGDCSWIGIGACVRQLVTVGSDVVVGAGAAVVNPIEDNLTVAGVPARVLQKAH